MREPLLDEWIALWRERDVALDQGLSESELAYVETEYGFHFPPDHRALLKTAQPTSHDFIDWRHTASSGLRGLLTEPIEGVLDAVQGGRFWASQWGERPNDTTTAREVTRRELGAAPTLIPFWGGIYIPDDPSEGGNPLFSVYGEDIVFIAESLYALAKRSRSGSWFSDVPGPMRYIRLWSDIASR